MLFRSQETRADSAETETEPVTRAVSQDAEQSPARVCVEQALSLQDAREQGPAPRKADAAERPAEPVRAKASAEKLKSTETITRER